jgi:cytochrome c oxidase assembly protein subunit 15
MTGRQSPQTWLARTSLAGCLLMAAIILSSAFLRLTTMGIGCEPWPACYGQLKSASATPAEQVSGADSSSSGRALVASCIGHAGGYLAVLIFLLTLVRGVRSRVTHRACAIAIVLTVVLAVVRECDAIGSRGGELLGGFSMLACFWMLYQTIMVVAGARAAPRAAKLRPSCSR